MKSVTYPINLNSDPYYREHDIAFLLCEVPQNIYNRLLSSVHLLIGFYLHKLKF